MNVFILIKFIVALLLGSAIGLERETTICNKENEKWTLGGVRTFALISLLGGISGFLYLNQLFAFGLILTGFMFLAVLIFYLVTALRSNSTGLTTEMSALLAYIIGFLCTTNFVSIQIVIALATIIVLILSHKAQTRKFVLHLDRTELNSFVSFCILALVVLPFLPDVSILLKDIGDFNSLPALARFLDIEIINPYRLWLIVVLVSGFGLLSYSLRKKVGNKRGLYLGSFLSGHISSTITNQVLSLKSKSEGTANQLQFGIANIFAYISSMMHFSFLIFILNLKLFVAILPVLLSIIVTSLIFTYVWNKANKKQVSDEIVIPFKDTPKLFLMPAIIFAVVITLVKIITQASLVVFGNKGFAISSALSSLVGTDAAIINISELTGSVISISQAIFVALLVNTVNLFGKWIYSSIKGTKEFAKLNLIYSSVVILVSFIVYLLFFI